MCLHSVAGVHVFSEQPGTQGDSRTVQVRPSQRLHPGQPLSAVRVSSRGFSRLQDQTVDPHRVSEYIWWQWRSIRVSHSTEDVLRWLWPSIDLTVSQYGPALKEQVVWTQNVPIYPSIGLL